MSDRARWEARYAKESRDLSPPSDWVIARALELPPAWMIVELAAGRGRHALALARAGRRVVAVDLIERAVATAHTHPEVQGVVADVGALPFRVGALDALLMVNFLDRALFPRLGQLLRPGGCLIAETYLVAQGVLAESSHSRGPHNVDYLLSPGELPKLVGPLRVRASHEGRVTDAAGARWVAGVVAVREADHTPGDVS